MHDTSHRLAQAAAKALHPELHRADDTKIRRIAAMLDEVSDATGKQAILDPLRARLRTLKTVRPLRFPRVLFTPFDPVIVAARQWKPGEATIPRTVLNSIAGVVRAGLGQEASAIDAMIAGHQTNALQVITEAGAVLWPRAAEILAVRQTPPADWAATGVRDALFGPLVQTLTAVLRRAPKIRALSRDAEVAVLATDEQIVGEILLHMGDETPEGCAMIAQLVLLQAPLALPLLRRFLVAAPDPAQKTVLYRAIAKGTEHALSQMESGNGIVDEIERLPLGDVAAHLRRITTLLREIGRDSGASGHQPRIKAIRERLDAVCRSRFADSLNAGLIEPLAPASSVVDAEGQTRMEIRARDLRKLETVARTVAGSATYDSMLHQAAEAVRAAGIAGRLTPARKLRLIEILAGAEAAIALYRKEAVRAAG